MSDPRELERLGALARGRFVTPVLRPAPEWLLAGGVRRRRGARVWLALGTVAAAATLLLLAPRGGPRPPARGGAMGSVAPRPRALVEARPELDRCAHAEVGPTGLQVRAVPDEPWVSLGQDGRLQYRRDERGNRVPDFSFAGYHAGARALPTVPAAGPPIAPGADDAGAIQAAIDALAAGPPGPGGVRGAIEVGAGTFHLARSLRIPASGIVLRGQGARTVLVAAGPAIVVGTEARPLREGPVHAISDEYVPVGAMTFDLADVTGLAVGDDVIVERPATRSWECALGMDRLGPGRDGEGTKPWLADTELRFDRRITRIDGRRVTIDAPLTSALEREHTAASLRRYRFPERLAEVGVEQLVLEAAPGAPAGEAALLDVGAAGDGWIRGVTVRGELAIGVRLGRAARRITVVDTSVMAGPNKAIGFQLSGQLNLIRASRAEGANLRAVLTTAAAVGPNAVVELAVVGAAPELETQRRWATGLLLDGVRVADRDGHPSGLIAVANQGSRGTGHGWSGANSMVWNCQARRIVVDSPPTAHNWVVGGQARARYGTGAFTERGLIADPPSLYRAQLDERGL